MKNKRNNQVDPNERGNNREIRSSRPNDLPDSKSDSEKLGTEETYIDLPDVKDIPGQEFVNAPPAGMMGDTTISSDDEEGRNVFDREDADGNTSDVGRSEREALEQVDYMPTRDEDNLQRARMDHTDFENEPLNEASFGRERSGSDLDIPGSEIDDRNERIGEEDEENNSWSVGSSS